MKKILLAMSLLVGGVAFAQQDLQEQINQLRMEIDQLRMAPPPSIDMPMPPEEMESPLRKKFNMYFNFQTSLDAERIGENNLTTKFQARQLRLEVRGDLTERIFYRFRHRLNKSNAAVSLDNLATATDMMYAGFRLNEKWTATVGKMCQMWGGYEFDLNPMNIYEYSDFLQNMDNFMLGAMITYTPNPNHEFNLQITDVRNDSFKNIYGSPIGIKASNTPLAYIFNWNGNLFDSLIQTRWGAGLQSEADGYTNTLVMLGTKLNLPKFQMFLDYMMANDQLDRLCYTPNSKDNNDKILGIKDAKYSSFVLKAEYQPAPEWNIFAQGLYETANSSLANNEFKGIGYFAGVEYLPFKEQDLRFFLAYIGRSRDKNSAVENTNRVRVGLMYRIKAF